METKTVEVVKTVSRKSTLFLRVFCRKIKRPKNFVFLQNPKMGTFVKKMKFFLSSFFDKINLENVFGDVPVLKKGFLNFRDADFKSRHFSDLRTEFNP